MNNFGYHQLNESLSKVLSDAIPYISRTLNSFQESSCDNCDTWNLFGFLSDINFNCGDTRQMMETFCVDLLIYMGLSMTSVLTALVATKTFVTYRDRLVGISRMLLTHLEDWFMFWFTASWLLFVSQPYGLCVLWRWSVTLYMKLRYGTLGDICSAKDTAGSLDMPEARQIIKSIKVLKGKCSLSILREKIDLIACKKDGRGKRLLYPKFHQYLDFVGGFYVWKPAKYDVKHHVRFIDGYDEESPSVGETELLEIVSKYSNTAFEKGRGLWEILVIPKIHYDYEEEEGVEKEEKFAVLVRLSHGVGDGFSFMKLVMREMAGEDVESYVPPSGNAPKRNWLTKIFIFLYLFFKSPRSFYKQLVIKDENPLHNSDIQMTGEKVHIWSKPLDVEWLKQLKNELGYGMSTILMNTLATSCRKYMLTRKGLPEGDLPRQMLTIIPVPAPNHPDNQLVNKFSIVMLPLELRRNNTADRCKEIEKENKIMATSPDCYMNLFLMELLAVFNVNFSRYLIVNKQCTTVISNLPGPKKQISLWGYPMMDMMFWLPNVGTSGISVSYFSYGNKMRFGLAVDTGVIQDGKEGAELILKWMLEDLKDLAASVNLRHTDDEMYIKMGANPAVEEDRKRKVKEKEETESSDYGYGGEPSDVSTADTDEDVEELNVQFVGVGDKGARVSSLVTCHKRNKSEGHNRNSSNLNASRC